jgi:hypothetical protein
MPRLAIIIVVLVVLAAPATALATVRAASFTSRVQAGDYASLTVRVAPRARCMIEVVYDTVVSRARGLGAKTGTAITWRWRVGTSTHPGRWPVTVRCGKSGTLRLRLRVLPR